MKEMLYAVRCLKSNEDMILALAGQLKQLSHEPEKHFFHIIFCHFAIFVVACISGHRCKNNENNIKAATLANTTNH